MNIVLNMRLIEATTINYPNDIAAIRAYRYPHLIGTPDWAIQHAWEVFSECLCAGWLIVSTQHMEEFSSWLESGKLP